MIGHAIFSTIPKAGRNHPRKPSATLSPRSSPRSSCVVLLFLLFSLSDAAGTKSAFRTPAIHSTSTTSSQPSFISTYNNSPPRESGSANRAGAVSLDRLYFAPRSRNYFTIMKSFEKSDDDNSNEKYGYDSIYGQETMEPIRFHDDDNEEGNDRQAAGLVDIVVPESPRSNNETEMEEKSTAAIIEEEVIDGETHFAFKYDDVNDLEKKNNEQLKPRKGRPGIVVFSGGTAFNAAAAEMASRNVGANVVSGSGKSGGSDGNNDLWRLDSWESTLEMMVPSSRGNSDGENNSSTNDEAKKAISDDNSKGNAISAGGTKVWHVLPVTDDGGSTAEIVRVLGGPAVGDIRSRLLRLAPGTTAEARAVRRLLGHRLVSMESLKRKGADCEDITPDIVSRMAREEWLDLLDGGHETCTNPCFPVEEEMGYNSEDGSIHRNDIDVHEHPLWQGVSAPYRSIIRSFLVHFHTQVLQTHNGLRHSVAHPPFDFTGGSVGNFFFAGARTFFGSLPAAIFLFSKVAGIPSGSRVIPAVQTEERLVLGAMLKDGTRIRGQYNISHPQPKMTLSTQQPPASQTKAKLQSSSRNDDAETSQRERSGSTSSGRHRAVVKTGIDSQEVISSLHPSPMSRVTYLLHDPTWRRQRNMSPKRQTSADSSSSSQTVPPKLKLEWSDRHEIFPEPNPLVLDAISNANCIVYGCGSLFTSVLPSLVLEGVGQAIAELDYSPEYPSSNVSRIPRVLLMNGWHDCETTWTEKSESGNGDLEVKRMDATMFVKAIVDALDQGCIRAGLFTDLGIRSEGSVVHKNDTVRDADRSEEDASHFGKKDDRFGSKVIPSVTDYITHILYPIGTEIEIDEQSLYEVCLSRQRVREKLLCQSMSTKREVVSRITVVGVASIPANRCSDGRRSGGQSHLRVFDPRALVDSLLDLANGGTGITDERNISVK
ncbi:hypothetical protein ACHAXS_006489 [Conticribra weissflogii]